MTVFLALACCGMTQLSDGVWRMHSRFRHAINLANQEGALLSFYRAGKGIGPGGFLFARGDFDRLLALPDSDFQLLKRGNQLRGARLQIAARRELLLTMAPGMPCFPDLAPYAVPTGLCGPLNQRQTDAVAVHLLKAGLTRWASGETPDWCGLVGLGPGLTPSGDDMLVGALAVLYTSHFRDLMRRRDLLPPPDQLARLTTSVSCSYLNSARNGCFSLPVLRLMRDLQRGRQATPAISRLTSFGHTSGADLLAGIVTALYWLTERG
ncbi:DUF2877 domain-containing protein [Entomohabitans teleogrylli]|uniref:DUF2877 domain-containing protein n=1 Tax=Entomohabitans teleogrylli TaxID=1384589 RepID=UPI00073D23FD|nr:DUF2877 domain-containing protein [Entomohabitans teleogrylli]